MGAKVWVRARTAAFPDSASERMQPRTYLATCSFTLSPKEVFPNASVARRSARWYAEARAPCAARGGGAASAAARAVRARAAAAAERMAARFASAAAVMLAAKAFESRSPPAASSCGQMDLAHGRSVSKRGRICIGAPKRQRVRANTTTPVTSYICTPTHLQLVFAAPRRVILRVCCC